MTNDLVKIQDLKKDSFDNSVDKKLKLRKNVIE